MANISKNSKSNKRDYLNSRVYSPKKITWKTGVGFGMIDLMGGGWNNIVSGVIFTFLMFQGIEPAIAGAITGIGRIIDAVFSLFIGDITDNFYKNYLGRKFGRRHFFIFFGGIIFACVFPLFWLPIGEFWFYLIVYIVLEVVIAFILIPWETLPTEMTKDYKKRTVLSGTRMFISATGTSLVFIILAVLKGTNNPDAYLITGVIWTVIFVIAIFISWGTTWETPLTKEVIAELDAKPKKTFLQVISGSVKDYFSTFRNKAFRKHLAVYILSFTGKDFYATMLPTFVIYCLIMNDSDAWLLLALSAIGIPVTLLATRIMITKGPRFLFALSYSLIIASMVAYASLYIAQLRNPLVALIVISLFFQSGRAILEFTPWNVFPFIPDVDRIMTRKSRAGIYAAVMTFFRKSTGALATWAAGILLDVIGFKPAPKGSSLDQIHGYAEGLPGNITTSIMVIFFSGTVLLIALALIFSRFFRLNKETHAVLVKEIDRLEAGGSMADANDEAKSVAEKLTGHKYETLWKDE
ncbi:MAG: MFS transporter [Bifidobacteriaceae bacterium]|jgi:oligogalacturonide transporter|nr:MFS transporter [Bifidobacteriaceae bacterium]